MSVRTCPSCHSDRLVGYPASRRTDHHNFRCSSCGLVGWFERDEVELPDVFDLEAVPKDHIADWHDGKRDTVAEQVWHDMLDRVGDMLGPVDRPRLYDVGAGDGEFLALARKRGYEVGGNDVLQAAVELAKERYDIELGYGDIADLEVPEQDVVTLWCVIAHVTQPYELLRNARRMLRPGGVLFLQTPHYCSVDRASLALLRGTGGRASRWIDRRLAVHHWFLHTEHSMTEMLTRLGFTDIVVEPQARYTLSATSYVESLGFKGGAGRALARAADRLIERGLAPRIALDVYARRPAADAST